MSISDISTSKINESTNPFRNKQNLVKISLDDIDINKNSNEDDEDVIDKIEKKIYKATFSDNFTR